MPRRTRTGVRPNIYEDDRSDAENIAPGPETPSRTAPLGREPLGEIVNMDNAPQQEANIVLEIDLSKATRKSPKKDDFQSDDDQENVHEVLEDACPSDPSPAVEEVRYVLKKYPGKATSVSPSADMPRNPSSRAAIAARKQLLPRDMKDGNGMERKGAAEPHMHYLPRSPTPKAPLDALSSQERIEDSVEALDALEDAIAEIGSAITPQCKDIMDKSSKQGINPARIGSKESQAARRKSSMVIASVRRTSTTQATPAGRVSGQPRTTKPGPKVASTTKANQASTLSTPRRSAAGRPSTVGGRPVVRPASLRKTPFVPTRSSKPVTTSTFTLPGEAVAARLKAQREERQQRQNTAAATATVRGTAFTGPNSRARSSVLSSAVNAAPTRHVLNGRTNTRVQTTQGSVRVKPPCGPSTTNRRVARSSGAGTTSTRIIGTHRATDKAPLRSPPQTLTEIFNPPDADTAIANSPSCAVESSQSNKRLRSTRVMEGAGSKSPSVRAVTGQRSAAAVSKPGSVHIPAPIPKVKAATLGSASGARARMMAREQAAQERKAKEETSRDAARRARLDAAEKGRLASREWAERQRAKAAAAAHSKPAVEKMVEVMEIEIGAERTVV